MDQHNSKEVQRHLCQLVALNGFVSDSNVPGTEKLTATWLDKGWIREPSLNISAETDLGLAPKSVPPQTLFMVKGWNRSVCGLAVLYAMFDCEELRQAGL